MDNWDHIQNKIKSREDLKEIIGKSKASGKVVVHTNGAYDIIHKGHILLLSKAKDMGDVLIVSLNSDESIRRFKGPNRPILGEETRLTIIAALECVDYVTLFPEDEVIETLKILKPNIHVKGRGVIPERIQREEEFMNSIGGKMSLIPVDLGNSTTQIIQKIKGDANE